MRDSSLKVQQAALSIEEVFEQPKPQQLWLLTYLDVFVLIIMLVITLLTLSSFESEEKSTQQQTIHNETQKQKTQNKKPIENITSPSLPTAPVSIPLLSIKTIETVKPIQSALAEDTKNIDRQPKESNQIEDLPTENKIAQTEISTQLQTTIDNQQDSELLQQKLAKTVEELGLIDSVKMKVTLGYAQLEIQDKVLFDSSKAKLLNAGEALLKKLAPLLEQSLGLIYIEGHTDNRPIKTRQYPSNWELGAARATSVLHYLVSQKIDNSRLRAVTYADTKPLADNSSKEGRGKNRRVSIVIKVSDKID